ncbi:DNA polymerase I [Mycobacteroides abscessus subsp. abscessus]|nr:DNA polymerase I [Mycobacteroides abscessus subsp. abscessus]SLH24683.1 DNA polymerase I [Mycobacteroides abscessus subsp. abscessus]
MLDMTSVTPDAPAVPAYSYEVREVAGVRVQVGVGVHAAQELLPAILSGEHVSVDIETYGTAPADRWRIKAVGIGSSDGRTVVVLDPRDPRQGDLLRDTLDRTTELHVHNAAFDAPILMRAGLLDAAVDRLYDTLVVARMSNPGGQNSLSACASRLLGLPTSPSPWADLPGTWSAGKWYREADLSRARYLDGLVADVSVTARLCDPLIGELRRLASKAPFWAVDEFELRRLVERETTIMRMMVRRTAAGLPADLDYADAFRDRYSVDIQLRAARLESAGIKASAPNTMSVWLQTHGHIDSRWERTGTGKPSTAKKLLKSLANRVPEVADYLTVRGAEKTFAYLDTISQSVEATGLVHPTVNVGAARTGRMSISDPALQQFPAAARGILLSPFDKGLVSIDWSSIEVVVAAAIGQDAGLLRAIANGLDPYSLAIEAAGIGRDIAKVVILAGQYGQGPTSLARTLGITVDEAVTLRDTIFASMPGVQGLIATMTRAAHGGHVTTLSGRTIPIARVNGQLKAYTGTNYVVQGSAYDLMAEALYEIARRGLGEHVMLAVHDELVVNGDPAVVAEVAEIMSTPPARLVEHVGDLPLTLRAEPEPLGDRWGKPGKSTDLATFDIEEEDSL